MLMSSCLSFTPPCPPAIPFPVSFDRFLYPLPTPCLSLVPENQTQRLVVHSRGTFCHFPVPQPGNVQISKWWLSKSFKKTHPSAKFLSFLFFRSEVQGGKESGLQRDAVIQTAADWTWDSSEHKLHSATSVLPLGQWWCSHKPLSDGTAQAQ